MATTSKNREPKNDSANALVPGAPRLPMPVEAREQYLLTEEQWLLLVDNLYPSAQTVHGVLLALAYCRAHNLNIFRKPVNIVPMWSKEKQRMIETVWEGFNSFLTVAHRTNEFAGVDEPEFGPDKTVTFRSEFKDYSSGRTLMKEVTITYPEWVKVPVYRAKNDVPRKYVAKVHWRQIFATARTNDGTEFPNDMWIRRPHDQLAKCGTVASLRLAFPEEMPGYCAEEMHGRVIDDVDYVRTDGQASVAGGAAKSNPFDSIPAYDETKVSQTIRTLIAQTCENALRAGVATVWDQSAEWVLQRFSGDQNSVGYALTMLKRCREEGIVPPVMPAAKAPVSKPETRTVKETAAPKEADLFGIIPEYSEANVPDKTKRTVVQACRNALRGGTPEVWRQAVKWARDTYVNSQDRLGFALALLKEAWETGLVPEVNMTEESPAGDASSSALDQAAMTLFGAVRSFDESKVPDKTKQNVAKACESARNGGTEQVWKQAVHWAHSTYEDPDRLGYALAQLRAAWVALMTSREKGGA